jgi:hypothetical protein
VETITPKDATLAAASLGCRPSPVSATWSCGSPAIGIRYLAAMVLHPASSVEIVSFILPLRSRCGDFNDETCRLEPVENSFSLGV